MIFIVACAGAGAAEWAWRGPALPPPEAIAWRDAAAPFENVGTFDAALDDAGQLWVVTLQASENEASVALHRHGAAGWETVARWPTVPTEVDRDEWSESEFVSLVHHAGQVWVAWRSGPEGLCLTTADRTRPVKVALPDDAGRTRVGLVSEGDGLSVLVGRSASSHRFGLWQAEVPRPLPPSGKSTLAWTLLGHGHGPYSGPRVTRRHGRVAWVLQQDDGRRTALTWPPRDRRLTGDRCALAPTRGGARFEPCRTQRGWWFGTWDGTGAAVRAFGTLRFAGGHLDEEVNRLEIRRRGRLLAPPGQPLLRVPHAHDPPPVYAFFTRPEPYLMFDQDGRLYVLRWDGMTWWGLQGAPADHGLGDPEVPAWDPWVSGDRLRWVEQHDAHGHVVAEARFTRDGFGPVTRHVASSVAPHARGLFAREVWSRVTPAGDGMVMALAQDGVWHRLWGSDATTAAWVVEEGGLVRRPPIDDGTVVAVGAKGARAIVQHVESWSDGVLWDTERRFRPYRWETGTWVPDGLTFDLDRVSEVMMPAVDPPLAVFQERGTQGDDRVEETVVFRRGDWGWELMPGTDALTTRRPDEGVWYDVETEMAAHVDGAGAVWLAWRYPRGEDRVGIAAARATSEGWVRLDPPVTSDVPGAPGLGVDPEGRVVLAWPEPSGLRLVRFGAEGSSAPVSAWAGESGRPAVFVNDGRLCLAIAGPTSRETQVGVRCEV
ncbi:MAG: hypothetical protein AAF602_16500, partial [Myxococcota bacterium]